MQNLLDQLNELRTGELSPLGMSIKFGSPNLIYLKFERPNRKSEKLLVSFYKNINCGGKHSLPNIWYKKGYIGTRLQDWWSIETYVDMPNGDCCMKYNPQHKLSEDGKRFVLDFRWVMPCTYENFYRLLSEILCRFYDSDALLQDLCYGEGLTPDEHAVYSAITIF